MKRKRILSQKEFLGKVLKQDAFAKKIFEKLVELGCDQDMLSSLLKNLVFPAFGGEFQVLTAL